MSSAFGEDLDYTQKEVRAQGRPMVGTMVTVYGVGGPSLRCAQGPFWSVGILRGAIRHWREVDLSSKEPCDLGHVTSSILASFPS